MSVLGKLDAALKAVCPIAGVSIGRRTDKKTWRVDCMPEATPQQRAAAQSVIDAFDVAVAEAPPSANEQEQACRDYLSGASGAPAFLNLRNLFIAKAIRDEAHRLNMTAPNLMADTAKMRDLCNQLAEIYKEL